MKKVVILLSIVLCLWLSCENPGVYDDLDTYELLETNFNSWEIFASGGRINVHHFQGQGTYYLNYLGQLNSRHIMIKATPYFSVYYGAEKTELMLDKITWNWREPITFTVPELSEVYIEARGGGIGLYALKISPESQYQEYPEDVPLPELSYAEEIALEISPTGNYTDMNAIDFEASPAGMVVFFTTDGSDPVLVQDAYEATDYLVINGGSFVIDGNIFDGFETTVKFKGMFFNKETPVLERTFSVSRVSMSGLNAIADFSRGKSAYVQGFFSNMTTPATYIKIINFIESGTFWLEREYSNTGTFTYQVDGNESQSIPLSAVSIPVDETTTIKITIAQGDYYGSGTEYKISTWME